MSYYLTSKQAVLIITTDIYKIKSTFYITSTIKLCKRWRECIVEGIVIETFNIYVKVYLGIY